MTISDRLTRGFIAGVASELVRFPIGLIITAMVNVKPQLRYLDFASIIIFGHKPQGLGELIFSELAVVGWTGGLGVVFAYLITYMTSVNYRFKGALYGLTVWFAVYGVTALFRIPQLIKINLYTVVTNSILSALWGYLVVEALAWMDRRVSELSDEE